MTRQKHGFDFEKSIIEEHGLKPSQTYTSEWDAFHGKIPVSVKVAKNGSDIEMADIFRNARVSQNFILIVGFWEEEKTNITEVHTLYIEADEWTKNFDSELLDEFKELLNSITNDTSDDERWKSSIKEGRRKWKERTSNLIRPRFKRDSKKQKRIQCAINHNDFRSEFLPKYKTSILKKSVV